MAAALAILTEALDEPGTDIAHSLHRLTLDAAAAIPSHLGLSVVVSHSDPPFTVTTLADGAVAGDICTSLHVPLPGIGAGHEPASVAVILYAGTPGTFVDLAADLAWLTGGHRPTSCSTSTSPSPPDQTPPINYTPKPAPAQYFPTASVRCLLRHDHPDRPWPEPADNEVPDLLPRTRRAPSALQNKRGSTPSNALATASEASHTPPWTASRSATERARRASRPSPRIVGRPPPRRTRAMRRMLSNCVPATTGSHSAPQAHSP